MTSDPAAHEREPTPGPDSDRTIASPFTLGCGAVLGNRVIKAAMTECLASARTNAPNARIASLYARWAAMSRAGALITGNIQVDRRWLEAPRNVVVEDERDIEALRDWADGVQRGGRTRLIAQLSHAGRQCPVSVTGLAAPPAPSALRGVSQALPVFNRSRAMSEPEILDVVARFAAAARVLARAGFAGVEVHAAHGYLISQFLSPRTNLRRDAWGGSLEGRSRLLLEVVRAVRAAVPRGFIVAVKLNSADFQRGGFSEDDAVGVVAALEAERVDLLEISGGNYESSKMMEPVGPSAARSAAREAFFVDFAARLRRATRIPIMLTGGIRSLACMSQLLSSGTIDFVGLGRPFAVAPRLVAEMLHVRPAACAYALPNAARAPGRVRICITVCGRMHSRSARARRHAFQCGVLCARECGACVKAFRYAYGLCSSACTRAAQRAVEGAGDGMVFPSTAFSLGFKVFEAAEENLCHQACMRAIADGREPDLRWSRGRTAAALLTGVLPIYVWSPGKSGPVGWFIVGSLLAAASAALARALL